MSVSTEEWIRFCRENNRHIYTGQPLAETESISRFHPEPGPVQPERADDQALEMVRRPQEGVEGRIIVRITVRKCGVLQDSDNCMVKPLVDQLRYAGIIPEDNPGVIKLEVEQTRVKTKAEAGTEVVVIWP